MKEAEKIAVEIFSTVTKLKILKHLQYRNDYIANIAKALGKDRSTIHRHLKTLEEIDLVYCEIGTLDKKKKFYFLTEKGRTVIELAGYK